MHNVKDEDNICRIMKKAMEREKVMKEKEEAALEDVLVSSQSCESIDNMEDISQEENSCENDNEEILEEDNIEEEKLAEEGATDEECLNKASDSKQEKSGKSFFKNSKSKELAAKDQKIEELNDRVIRTMAEFENFRKRNEKEKAQMYDIGAKSVIEKVLPVIDNFERGLSAITEKEKEGAFAQGIDKIYKQFLTTLEEIGVKPIDAVGKEFDPNLHNAVMHGDDESLGDNIVSDEFQKGYMYRDTVVRHSMVKVVN